MRSDRMKKLIITVFFVIAAMFIVTPINTQALSIRDTAFSSVYILDEEDEESVMLLFNFNCALLIDSLFISYKLKLACVFTL